jgi:CMP-2-keto-3-deoxyoctulosonic acid synthetase
MSEPAPLLYGWKDIANALGVHVHTAQRWARRNVDPLPVRVGHRGVYALRAAMVAWVERQDMPLQASDEINRLRALLGERAVTVGRDGTSGAEDAADEAEAN